MPRRARAGGVTGAKIAVMIVAVTAASGRLGHAIIRHLLRDASVDGVVAVARTPGRVRFDGVDIRAGDYAEPDSLEAAFAGVDTLILISAPVVPGTDRAAMHRNAIRAAERAGVGRIVYTSIIGNGAEEDTRYGPTQRVNRDTEADLRASSLAWVVGRAGLYLDLDLGHLRKANETGGVYRNNGGSGRCGYVSIDELGFAFARLAPNAAVSGQVLNLIGETKSQAELVALANDVFDLDVRFESMTAEENVARFMADPRVAARGEEVAQMLTGCFESIERGAFDVSSDFERATGRPCKSVRAMMEDIRATADG